MIVILLLVALVSAQTRLVDRQVPYTQIPYQVDTDGGIRGPQAGYNRCNASTVGPGSLCQTAYVNSVDDFCLWSAQDPDSVVGDVEGEMVAWCTKAILHGTRQIPPGALKGVHFVKTPGYVQVTGIINQTLINLQADDAGGEMDSAGADNRGNPIGSLVYSNRFPGNRVQNYTQMIHWHNFMGNDIFCFKACDPAGPNAARLCEHVYVIWVRPISAPSDVVVSYDRVGCNVNAPANYSEGVFEECLGDDQDPPGVYTGTNGQVSTWYQPPEGQTLGALPYSPRIPPSSSCVQAQSSDLYVNVPVATSVSVLSTPSLTLAPSFTPTLRPTVAEDVTPSSPASSSLDTTSSGAHVCVPSILIVVALVSAVGRYSLG